MSIQTFSSEFDKRQFKIKSYGSVMSDDILAYTLLQQIYQTTMKNELIKATITDLQYNLIKGKVKKTFSDASRQTRKKINHIIKTKETFLAEEINQPSVQYHFLQNKALHEQ